MKGFFGTLLRAMATFLVSFGMGMTGFALGAVIFLGISDHLLRMEEQAQLLARIIGFTIIYGSALVGGVFGLQKGARWTRLMDHL